VNLKNILINKNRIMSKQKDKKQANSSNELYTLFVLAFQQLAKVTFTTILS